MSKKTKVLKSGVKEIVTKNAYFESGCNEVKVGGKGRF